MPSRTLSAQEERTKNKASFIAMLGHLGRKEFDSFEEYLAEDIFQDWPYLPIPNMPSAITGRRKLRDFIASGSAQFDPYDYKINHIYEMADPALLIAEYTSHTVYRPTRRPYSNSYLGILRFDDGKVTQWREYLNPLVIKESMLADFEKPVPAS